MEQEPLLFIHVYCNGSTPLRTVTIPVSTAQPHLYHRLYEYYTRPWCGCAHCLAAAAMGGAARNWK
jgi:hypothetical protein